MASSCCGRPVATIIRVADFDAGIMGLENAFLNVYRCGVEKEEELMNELLKEVRAQGNYISPSREDEYKKALLREYRTCVAKAMREPVRGRKGS
jgi:hypothetical protein